MRLIRVSPTTAVAIATIQKIEEIDTLTTRIWTSPLEYYDVSFPYEALYQLIQTSDVVEDKTDEVVDELKKLNSNNQYYAG